MNQDDAMKDFINQAFGNKPRNYPDGRISDDDDGELAVAIAADHKHNRVVIRLAVPTTWIAMTPEQAIQFAGKLTEFADKLKPGEEV